MSVSTHVLDTGSGTPAAGIPVRLDHYDAENWRLVQEGETDATGRWSLSFPETDTPADDPDGPGGGSPAGPPPDRSAGPRAREIGRPHL
ncbi:hydroxyisourate hydrolase [Spirillospora sp. NPDC049652]